MTEDDCDAAGSTGGSGSERTPQRNAKKAANWLINDLFGRLHKMRGTPAVRVRVALLRVLVVVLNGNVFVSRALQTITTRTSAKVPSRLFGQSADCIVIAPLQGQLAAQAEPR